MLHPSECRCVYPPDYDADPCPACKAKHARPAEGQSVPPYLAGFEAGWEAATEWIDREYTVDADDDLDRTSRYELLTRLRRLLA